MTLLRVGVREGGDHLWEKMTLVVPRSSINVSRIFPVHSEYIEDCNLHVGGAQRPIFGNVRCSCAGGCRRDGLEICPFS